MSAPRRSSGATADPGAGEPPGPTDTLPLSRFAFATVITRSYLPFARVLARRLGRFHDAPLYVVCVDEPEGLFDPAAEPFTLLTASDLLPEQDRSLLFYYTPFEACNALRGYLHKHLFEHTPHDRWLYLDSDIYVTTPLDAAFAAIDEPACGLISPHCLEPADARLLHPVETCLLKFGVYNSGFLGLRRNAEGRRFVDWFLERLRTLCFFMHRDVYVDQLWLNLVPEHFPAMRSWKHPGANVAYWNLHERRLRRTGEGLTANGEPLLFVHFSQWRYDAPADWRFGRTVAPDTDPTIIRDLGLAYRDELQSAGYDECRKWPYGYGRFADGREITTRMRRAYYDMLSAEAPPHGDPFAHPEWFPQGFSLERAKHLVPPVVKQFVRQWLN